MRAVSYKALPAPVVLNVNLPSLALAEIQGVEITRLGPRPYGENVAEGSDGRGTHYWIRHNRPIDAKFPEGTDTWAVRNNRISITPLALDLVPASPSQPLKALADEVAGGLGLRGPG